MCVQIRRTQHTQCKYPDSRSNTVKGVFGVWFCVDTNFIPCMLQYVYYHIFTTIYSAFIRYACRTVHG